MNRSLRVRMEAWRQWPPGGGDEVMTNTNHKNQLDSNRPSHGRRFHSLTVYQMSDTVLFRRQRIHPTRHKRLRDAVLKGRALEPRRCSIAKSPGLQPLKFEAVAQTDAASSYPIPRKNYRLRNPARQRANRNLKISSHGMNSGPSFTRSKASADQQSRKPRSGERTQPTA
jgi:hypothetical protein